jgi:hypothetical protein
MSLAFVSQILMQAWREVDQSRQVWLFWFAVITGATALGAAVASEGRNVGSMLISWLVTVLMIVGWLHVVASALKQSTPSNFQLVPGFRRRLVGIVTVTYVSLVAAIGATWLFAFGRFDWALSAVAIAAVVMAAMAFCMGGQLYAWIVAVIVVGGSSLVSGSEAARLLFADASRLPGVLVVIALGTAGLAMLLTQRRALGIPWSDAIWRGDPVVWQRPSSFAYRSVLRRDIAKRNIEALGFHSLGPGAHWTLVVVVAPALGAIFAYMLLTENGYLWMLAAATPALLTTSATYWLRSAAYVTRDEQVLVQLSPNVPRGQEWNRLILTGYARSFAMALLIAAVLCVIALFIAPVPAPMAVVTPFVIASCLPPALVLTTKYLGSKPPNVFSFIAPILLSGSATAVLFFTYDARPSLFLPVAATLVVMTIGALMVRWKAALRSPRLFLDTRA